MENRLTEGKSGLTALAAGVWLAVACGGKAINIEPGTSVDGAGTGSTVTAGGGSGAGGPMATVGSSAGGSYVSPSGGQASAGSSGVFPSGGQASSAGSSGIFPSGGQANSAGSSGIFPSGGQASAGAPAFCTSVDCSTSNVLPELCGEHRPGLPNGRRGVRHHARVFSG